MEKNKTETAMKKFKETEIHPEPPIIRPCYVDVCSIWKRAENKPRVSDDLTDKIYQSVKRSKILSAK